MNKKGFMLAESLLLFAGAVLLCVMILSSLAAEHHFQQLKNQLISKVRMNGLKPYMNKGFTSIEVLLSLWIISFSMLLLAAVLPMLESLIQKDDFVQDQIGLRQLRHILLLSEAVSAVDNTLSGMLYNEEYTLILDRRRLVKTPGYEIMLMDLSAMSFITKGECIYLQYQKNNDSKINERWLTCKQPGMDFTLFPDDAAADDLIDSADERQNQDSDAAVSE